MEDYVRISNSVLTKALEGARISETELSKIKKRLENDQVQFQEKKKELNKTLDQLDHSRQELEDIKSRFDKSQKELDGALTKKKSAEKKLEEALEYISILEGTTSPRKRQRTKPLVGFMVNDLTEALADEICNESFLQHKGCFMCIRKHPNKVEVYYSACRSDGKVLLAEVMPTTSPGEKRVFPQGRQYQNEINRFERLYFYALCLTGETADHSKPVDLCDILRREASQDLEEQKADSLPLSVIIDHSDEVFTAMGISLDQDLRVRAINKNGSAIYFRVTVNDCSETGGNLVVVLDANECRYTCNKVVCVRAFILLRIFV
jgi:hypothetical protein